MAVLSRHSPCELIINAILRLCHPGRAILFPRSESAPYSSTRSQKSDAVVCAVESKKSSVFRQPTPSMMKKKVALSENTFESQTHTKPSEIIPEAKLLCSLETWRIETSARWCSR
jgi:hypothetical protein